MRTLLLFASLLPLSPVVMAAQIETAPAIPAAAVPSGGAGDLYAAESMVLEHSDQVYSMLADGTGYHEQTQVVRVQSESAVRQLGILTVGYSGASERVEIEYARVRRPDGSVIETPVGDALEMPQPVTREAPFYSDLKQKQLPIKSLHVGDRLEWKIKVVKTKAEAPGQFWGQNTFVDSAVSLAETLELRVPNGLTVTVWTNPRSGLKPVESVAGEQKTYRWAASSLKPTTGPEADAETKRKSKEVWTADQELDAKEGRLPSVAWTTFKSWEEVGSWYRGLEGDRMVPDAALKAKVAELTAGRNGTEAKVRAVYGFVGPQVRYIGVAFGVGRYQPHHADEVLDNQYGDCKDKHTLLAAMLMALGLHPEAVLIGAGIRFNEAVPSPAAFNHLITRVDVDGTETWLDSTAEVAPYRMLSAAIRDKRALDVPENGPAKLVKTPALPPFASFQTMKVEGTLTPDGTETSHVTLTARGDTELMIREVLHQVPAAQYDVFSQKLWSGMGFDGTTSQPELSRPEDTAEPVSVAFEDKREKSGGDWEHYRVVAQLIPGTLPEVNEKEPPVQAIELGTPELVTSDFALKLPQGWSAELPEAVHEKTGFARYDMTYRFEKGTVYAQRKLEVLQEKVPVSEWKSYKSWFDKVQANSSPYIQLVRANVDGGGGGKGTATVTSTVTNQEAAKLIGEAFEAMRSMKLDESTPLLEEARKLNGQERGLWAAYGYLASLRGAPTEAVEDYRKELALHPEPVTVYPSLVYSLMQRNKRAEAMDTLRAWESADPGNPQPAMQLSGMQLADGKGDAAYATMHAAIEKLPEEKRADDHVMMALAQAEIKNGMKEQGAARLAKMLGSTEDPYMLNNGAYELSETGLELTGAETAERKALAKMDAETQSWTLDEAPAVLRGKSSLLAASWDTMGWILFREGKVEESRTYVEASWRNEAHAVVGEHLGDIEMALQHPHEALIDYELAQSEGSAKGELDAKVEKAKKANSKPVAVDGQKGLKELRTVKLGPASGKAGAAEYKILLAPGKVERVEAAGEKTVAGGAELIRAMKVPELFPSGSEARLAKKGILNCYAGTCELIFEP